jgi:hypothetical protein
MPFKHNSAGIDATGGFQPLPEGEYRLVIQDAEEMKSKKGQDMVKVTLAVIEHEKLDGKTLFHYVVFIPAGDKGDGMSVHFRKCIGMPYGGDDEVDASKWVGKKLRAFLKIEERDYQGKHYTGNKVAEVLPYGKDFPPVETDEDIPF